MNQQAPALAGLTPDQEAAADAFFDFLFTKDPTFVLSGGAGVGKTYLMSHLCKVTMKDYAKACTMLGVPEEYSELSFTATTNKAAEVLENSLQLPVSTIHSFLSLRVTEDYKTGKTNLIKTNSWHVRKKHIIFIDESGMVDTLLYDIIMESFKDSKIVFVGDHAQMAPIGEPVSPVFTNVDPKNFVFLSKPVRNAGTPALVDLCSQLRETVETGVFHPIKEVPGVIDYLDDDQMPGMLTKYFTAMDPSCRVLCFTNSRVENYNQFIREEVRQLPALPGVGDVLVVAQNYTSNYMGKTYALSVEREVEIVSTSPLEEDDNWEDATHGAPISYRECMVKVISGHSVTIPARLPYRKDKVAAATKWYASKKKWPQYFGIKDAFADLRDKAACTVYKSQGSTYEAVFIDLGNIGTSFDAKQVARMLFVAASRATTRIFLYGKLPPMYTGKPKP